MKANHTKIIVGATLAAAGITAFANGMTHHLMRIAMDRQEPKSMSIARARLMGMKENENLLFMLRTASQKLEEKVRETVAITAQDGVRLVGHWWPCKDAKRVIVAMHGWRSGWSQDFGIIADFWHNNNCSILFAEQRGQGESGGNYIGFGLMERYDCRRWVEWVNDTIHSILPIYLGGVSMGATTVLMTAGLDLPQNVVGVVSDCAFTSPHAIWKHVVEENLHFSYGFHGMLANDLCKKKINMSAKEYSTTEAVKNTRIPMLFIHGTDDNFVPIEMTFENYKACVAPKRLLVVPGANHGMSYLVDKENYENAILNFWKDRERSYKFQ